MESLFTDDEVGLKEKVSLTEVASILGVSTATIRNWVRHKYIMPLSVGRKLIFDPCQVSELKNQLSTGQLNRLNRRANKRESSTKFIPAEYAARPEVFSFIEFIINVYNLEGLDLKTSLLAIILNFLEKRDLITGGVTRNYSSIHAINKTFMAELQWWFKQTKPLSSPAYDQLITCDLPIADDLLGVIYQSLVTEGAKAHGGSYFTPKGIVDSILADHIKQHSTFLDPCCGTGQFLLAAADTISDPLNIWGFEN